MDKQQLVNAFKADGAWENFYESKSASTMNPLQFKIKMYNSQIYKRITTILAELPELATLKDRRIAKGYSIEHIERAATFLFRRSLIVDVEQAVENLEQVLNLKQADLHYVMIVSDVHCQVELNVTDSIKIMSLQQLYKLIPYHLIGYLEEVTKRKINNLLDLNSSEIKQAMENKIALIKTEKLTNVWIDNHKNDTRLKWREIYKNLNEIKHGLIATGKYIPIGENRWEEFSNILLEEFVSTFCFGELHEEIIPHRYFKGNNNILLIQEDIDKWVKVYLSLNQKLKNKMGISLERINQAKLRNSTGNRALELAIALESLLLGSEKGDNNFKLALRAALIFSQDLKKKILS